MRQCFSFIIQKDQNYAAVASLTKNFQAFVQKWVKLFKQVRNVDDLPEKGTHV